MEVSSSPARCSSSESSSCIDGLFRTTHAMRLEAYLVCIHSTRCLANNTFTSCPETLVKQVNWVSLPVPERRARQSKSCLAHRIDAETRRLGNAVREWHNTEQIISCSPTRDIPKPRSTSVSRQNHLKSQRVRMKAALLLQLSVFAAFRLTLRFNMHVCVLFGLDTQI